MKSSRTLRKTCSGFTRRYNDECSSNDTGTRLRERSCRREGDEASASERSGDFQGTGLGSTRAQAAQGISGTGAQRIEQLRTFPEYVGRPDHGRSWISHLASPSQPVVGVDYIQDQCQCC